VSLLCHRAVLFGIIGALLVTPAFNDPLRAVALATGLANTLGFVLVASR